MQEPSSLARRESSRGRRAAHGPSPPSTRVLQGAKARPHRAPHPHAPVLDAAVQLAAAPVLLKDGVEVIEEREHDRSVALGEPSPSTL